MVKKLKKSITKQSRKTRSFLKFTKNNKDIKNAFSILKYEMPIEDANKIIKELLESKKLRKHIMNTPFPEIYEEIKMDFPFHSVDGTIKELYWVANLLSHFSKKIDEFLNLKSKFEYYFLMGLYEEAESVLQNIKDNYGVSRWFIKNNILLLEEYKGIEKQKEFSKKIINNSKVSGQIKFLTNYYSMKAEKNISYLKFEKTLNEVLDGATPEIKNYYALNLGYYLNVNKIKDEDIPNILFMNSHSCVIDMYLNFETLIENIVMKSENIEISKAVEYSLERLFNKLSNAKLNDWSKFKNNELEITSIGEGYLSLLDKYSLGKYPEVVKQIMLIFDTKLPPFEIFEIFIKSYVNSGINDKYFFEDSILEKIFLYIKKLIKKEDGINEAYLELKRYTNILQDFTWAKQLTFFTLKLFNQISENNPQCFGPICDLPTLVYNPKIIFYIKDEKESGNIISLLEDKYNDSISLKLNKALFMKDISLLPHLDSIRLKKYKAQIYYQLGDFKNAINLFKEGYLGEEDTLNLENLVGLINSYLSNKEYLQCLKIIVSTYLKNNNLYPLYPFEKIYNEIKNISDPTFSSKLIVPIFYNLYQNHYDLEAISTVKDSFEDFLEFQDLEKPSDILIKIEKFEKEELIYFLKNICTQEIMDTHIAFSSTSEVEREVIAICQILSTLDEQRIPEYSDKIKKITQKLHIKNRLREIEQSKIYVDINGIKNTVKNTLKESYNRYVLFEEKSIESYSKDEILINLNNLQGITNGLHFYIPNDEKYDLLKNIYEEIRDYFVASNEYGLDGYLSVGIRHGTLAGHLRKPLELHHLVTQKEKIDDRNYKINYYWTEKYSVLNPEKKKILTEALNNFSNEIDSLINMLKNNWVQIKTEKKKNKGYFDFTITNYTIPLLMKELKEINTFDEFIDTVISQLWKNTDCSLYTIRNDIEKKLKGMFYLAFENLEKSVADIEVELLMNEVHQAQTEIGIELDKVSSWFTRSESKRDDDYDLELPVDIAIETINNLYPNKKVDATKSIKELPKFKGSTLKGFVDISTILLDNIVCYSKVKNFPIKVDIDCKKNDNGIFITFKNYNDESISEKSLETLESILKNIETKNHLSNVNKEGGSGISKIAKILKVDLGCEYKITYEHATTFFAMTINIINKG